MQRIVTQILIESPQERPILINMYFDQARYLFLEKSSGLEVKCVCGFRSGEPSRACQHSLSVTVPFANYRHVKSVGLKIILVSIGYGEELGASPSDVAS